MGRLDGRVAVITGGSEGIGRGIVLRFAKEGAKVAIISRRRDPGEAVVREVGAIPGATAIYLCGDVAKKMEVQQAIHDVVRKLGSLDILVNNAQAFTPFKPIEEKPDEDYQVSFESGFYGTLWCMKAALPYMRERGGGRIINLCSLWGLFNPSFTSDYAAVKEAIRSLTRSAANEWGKYNILVNAIAPAADGARAKAWRTANPEAWETMMESFPLGRLGDPEEDIAPAVVGLAAEETCFVTGQTIFVDGGTAMLSPQVELPGWLYPSTGA